MPLYVTTHGCSDHMNIDCQCSHYALCLKPATLTTAQDDSNLREKKKEVLFQFPNLKAGEEEKKVLLLAQILAVLNSTCMRFCKMED